MDLPFVQGRQFSRNEVLMSERISNTIAYLVAFLMLAATVVTALVVLVAACWAVSR